MISTFQSKKRLISEDPREVFDLMRWMPGIPFIASSIGRVTETRVCGAGATPLSTMITMRGKLAAGKMAMGSCQAAYNPPAQIRAIMTSTARDWFETSRARFTVVPCSGRFLQRDSSRQHADFPFFIFHFSFAICRTFYRVARVISLIVRQAE